MGGIWSSNHWSLEHLTFPHLRKELKDYPSDREESPFDPLYGFPNGRKQRGPKIDINYQFIYHF